MQLAVAGIVLPQGRKKRLPSHRAIIGDGRNAGPASRGHFDEKARGIFHMQVGKEVVAAAGVDNETPVHQNPSLL